MWTNRITAANSRKHQEFAGRVNSVNNKFELYQQLKDENGCVTRAGPAAHTRQQLPLTPPSPSCRMEVHENGKVSR